MQLAQQRQNRDLGSATAGPLLQRKMQVEQQQQLEISALKPGLRAAASLLMVAATGARQRRRQHLGLPSSQRSSQQATCLLRLPLHRGMMQPAFSSRQHMQNCHHRPMLMKAQSRLLSSRIRVAPCSRRALQMNRRHTIQVRSGSRRPQGAEQPKKEGANLQTKPSTSSGDLPASPATKVHCSQRAQAAAARVSVAEKASEKPVTEPRKDEQTLHKLSPPKNLIPRQAPGLPQVLLQSTSETAQGAGRSSMSDQSDAPPCGPCLPNAPNGQPTVARPAPVRLSKATLQHSQSSTAHSRPPPLHALLPTSPSQPNHVQVWEFSQAAGVLSGAAASAPLCALLIYV